MMRKLSFIVAVLGILFLVILLRIDGREVFSVEDLEVYELNQKVSFVGVVNSERDFGDFRILIVNGIEVVCSCGVGHVSKEVEVVGLVSEFNGKRQIEVLKIYFTG